MICLTWVSVKQTRGIWLLIYIPCLNSMFERTPMIESKPNNKTKKKRAISRRDFIKLSTIAVTGASIAACEPKPIENEEVMSSTQMAAIDQSPQVPFAPPEPPPDTLMVLTP